jgi:hypothetical protein
VARLVDRYRGGLSRYDTIEGAHVGTATLLRDDRILRAMIVETNSDGVCGVGGTMSRATTQWLTTREDAVAALPGLFEVDEDNDEEH